MNFFAASKKTVADLTYNRGKPAQSNMSQIIFEASLFTFLFLYSPIGLCLATVVGFLAATAYNMFQEEPHAIKLAN